MEARPAYARSSRVGTAAFARFAVQCAAVGCLAVVTFAGLLLFARRLSGALVDPLPAGALIALGCSLAAMAALWRRFAPLVLSVPGGRWLAAPAVFLAALAVSLPESSLVGLVGLWGLVLGEELVGWRLGQRRAPRAADIETEPPRPAPGDGIRIDPPQTPMPHFPAEEISQQFSRSRGADGNEVVTGWLRVEFEPGQRTAVAHVAFCPPFAETPRITVRHTQGPLARIKEGQVLPHGMRLDFKLTDLSVAKSCSVLVEFSAQAPAVTTVKTALGARG